MKEKLTTFLREMAQDMPYESRKIKGQLQRKEAAQELLNELPNYEVTLKVDPSSYQSKEDDTDLKNPTVNDLSGDLFGGYFVVGLCVIGLVGLWFFWNQNTWVADVVMLVIIFGCLIATILRIEDLKCQKK